MLSSSSEPTDASSHETPALPEHASPSSTGLPNDAAQHPVPRKSSWLRVVILILLIGGAIGFVTYRIVTNKPAQPAGGRRGGGANAIVPVSFDVVQKRTIPISLTALGTVTAYNTVTLKSRVDGQIIKVNFQEGQHVREGQSLIEIDPKPYQATLSVAQGNLARDQANAALAQVQATRYNQLYAAGVVSKESNQTQEATAGTSVGTLASDRAAIQQAQVNLNYTHITSPISGIVGLRQVDAGNIVTAASASGLVVITQVQPIAVIFTLPEDSIPAVFEHMRGGHKLVAEAWDRANTVKIATGSLLTVDNQIDTTTGTAKLKAVFENADSSLYPNQFVNIHLVLENRANSVVVPAAAIQTGNNGSFVYVIDRTQPQSGGAPGGAAGAGAGGPGGGRRSGGANGAAAGAAPAGGAGGGNTGADSQGGGAVSGAPGGGTGSGGGAGADATASGGPGAGGAGGAGGGRRGGAGGGAGGGGAQTSYPVHVVNVVVDTTEGTDVIIKSGLQPGQQVVTDGQEKLQDKSRVIPHPSADMVAARQARAAGGTPPPPSDPNAGAFSNGRGSDLDPTAGAAGGHHGQHGTGDAGAAGAGAGSPGGHHRGNSGGAQSPDGTGAAPGGPGGHHHRPPGAGTQ